MPHVPWVQLAAAWLPGKTPNSQCPINDQPEARTPTARWTSPLVNRTSLVIWASPLVIPPRMVSYALFVWPAFTVHTALCSEGMCGVPAQSRDLSEPLPLRAATVRERFLFAASDRFPMFAALKGRDPGTPRASHASSEYSLDRQWIDGLCLCGRFEVRANHLGVHSR
jgi:hypothetical protein